MAITHNIIRDPKTGRLDSRNPRGMPVNPPDKVVGLAEDSSTTSSITLSWSPVLYADTYNVYVNAEPTPRMTGVTGTQTTLTGLSDGSTYQVSVTGENVAGEGPPSDTVTMTTEADFVEPDPGETVLSSSVEQYGITWQFDQQYPVGQFITGDYYVIGPVTITSITRPNNNPERDGSMVNPMPGGSGAEHGFDGRWGQYRDELNVANHLPQTIGTGSSLVSKTSSTGNYMEDAAVLTVLDAAPSATAFRPPYSGTRKIIHDWNDVNLSILPNLPVVGGVGIQSLKSAHSRPWVALYAWWQGIQQMIPRNNMPPYGRDIAARGNNTALSLMLDIPQSDKEDIARGYIQTGIDLHENMMNGWKGGSVGGGLTHGFKLPGILAGVLLDNEEMKNFHINNPTREYSMDDSQIFLLTQQIRDLTYERGAEHPGYFDDVPLGTPVWIERGYKAVETSWMQIPGGLAYMVCCTTNATTGAALVVRLLGIQNLWNYDTFLDWVDLYQGYPTDQFYDRERVSESWHEFMTTLAREMWNTYRGTV